MLISELFEDEKNGKGTYAAAKFSKDSVDTIGKFLNKHDIKNIVKLKKLHCTILYSRTYIKDYKPAGKYKKPYECKPLDFDVWETQPDEKTGKTKNCLVLKLDCPKLKKRHTDLMTTHKEATYDYPEFKVHVTLSYDIGDNFDISKLDSFDAKLELDYEYGNDLESDWAKTAKK